MSNQPQRDDALFEALGKSQKKKKRKILTTVLVIILVAAIVVTGLVIVLRRRVQVKFGSTGVDVLSWEVKSGNISTLVSGSGILLNVDTENLTVPDGVEVTEILVEFGDAVAAGDLLAIVDTATVRTAMADVQTQIKELDKEIRSAEGDKVASYITAGVSGRVKAIYAQAGSSVPDVMVEHGALAVISLDGYMALKLETQELSVGDSVNVKRQDGTLITGKVESVAGGKATILVTDNGPKLDEEVEVFTSDDRSLGKGKLYIHNPLAVTGYAGTVKSITAKENAQVYASSQILTLKDTNHSANYDQLLRQRGELEETLLELLKLQRDGGLTAPISGSVLTVADLDSAEGYTDVVVLSADREMSVTISVDESDILALQLDQQADVTVKSIGDEKLLGVVTDIDKTASDGSYTAVITLDKLEGMLQGMTANVDVRIQGVDNALVIPADALHKTSEGAYVFTSYDPETEEYGGRVDVITGLSNDDYVEITSGLKEGDTVYYTESRNLFGIFGAMGGMGGMSGGQRPSGYSGGGMPSGYPGGQMPGGYSGGR